MSRGEKIAVTRAESVLRMLSAVCAVPVPPTGAPADAGQRAVEYRNDDSGRLGGYNPGNGEPWSWSFGSRTPTSDCVGAVFGAIGVDRRLMPWAFPEYSGDANCDSVLAHAKNTKTVFRVLEDGEVPIAGDVAVSPSTWSILGKRKSGHMELVIRSAAMNNTKTPLTAGCSPRHEDHFGAGMGVGTPWGSKVVYVRYLGFENDEKWRDSPTKTYAKYTGKK